MHDSNRRVLREARAIRTSDHYAAVAAASGAASGYSPRPSSDMEAGLLGGSIQGGSPRTDSTTDGHTGRGLPRRDSRTLWSLVRRKVGAQEAERRPAPLPSPVLWMCAGVACHRSTFGHM